MSDGALSTLGFDAVRLAALDGRLHRYVDEGRLPGVQLAVVRNGHEVHRDTYGWADVDGQVPVRRDTIYRIYSMTKPITSVALMMLFEEGHFLLEDPVSRWLPEFAAPQVWVDGDADNPVTEPAARPLTVKDMLTHTSGLTYGFQFAHPVDALYRRAELGVFQPISYDLDECMVRLAAQPLLFQPGTQWNYGMSTDVCGALVERISGQRLDEFFRERIFAPLGMPDTGFAVPEADVERGSVLYTPKADGSLQKVSSRRGMSRVPSCLVGGGGLYSTTDDYLRFCQFLANGGAIDDVRLLSPRTVAFMHLNHLPGNATVESMDRSGFSEVTMDGMGFGLGFSVVLDPAANGVPVTPGAVGWGGAASTLFWVDPVHDMHVVFMTQLLPSSTYPLRRQIQVGLAQAMVR